MAEHHKSLEVLNMLTEHAGIIHKLSYLYSNSKEEYEDLRQEISYQLALSFPSFEGKSKLGTWVYKVGLFTSLSYLRKRPKVTTSLDYLPDIVAEEDSDNQWEALLEVIKTLPEMEKSVVFLYLEDKSYKEMAEILGMSESNIGVRLNRIKSKLREHFKEQ